MADELTGDNNWLVEFNSDKQMVSNFASSNFDDVLDYMQPGAWAMNSLRGMWWCNVQ